MELFSVEVVGDLPWNLLLMY